MRQWNDVVVVGAGYAGLAAALRLQDTGNDVLVLEAADRVEGRTCSEARPDGLRIDHGGQRVPYQGTPPETGSGVREYRRVTALLDDLARTVDTEQPWRTPCFAKWNAQTALTIQGAGAPRGGPGRGNEGRGTRTCTAVTGAARWAGSETASGVERVRRRGAA